MCVGESPGFSIKDVEKILSSQVSAEEWNNPYICQLCEINSKKIKDLNKKKKPKMMKLLKKTNSSKHWKGGCFVCLFVLYKNLKYRKHKHKKIYKKLCQTQQLLHGAENN